MSTELLKAVLDCRSACETDPFSVLNLAPQLPPVTIETAVGDARRNYMRLAALVHPDKFTGKAELQHMATEAFQILVRVFERIANPDFRQAQAAKATNERKRAQRVERKRPVVSPAAANASGSALPTEKASRKKATTKEDSSDDDASSDDSDEEVDTAPPRRPNREVMARSRPASSAVKYVRTIVKCPRCATSWMPDDNKQYSLFMGYGLRIHCQLCLLLYGCAAATHCCVSCDRSFDYDTSMYDGVIKCANSKCAKSFGLAYYPVTGELVNRIREEEEAEAAKRQLAAEREARARARVGGDAKPSVAAHAGVSEDKMLEYIGSCVVSEQCPLCFKTVKSKHRAHVEECVKNPPAPKKQRRVINFIDDSDKKKRSRSTSSTARNTKRKSRRDDYSDSD